MKSETNKVMQLQRLLSYVLVPAVIICFYMIFVYAPNERTLGVLQRIFYIHVASAWSGFFAFLLLTGASVVYLRTRKLVWNEAAHAAGEVGVLFTTLALVSGSIWARPVWGVWWTWDPRLTTTLILWFIYVAYLLIQQASDGRERMLKIAAIVGIVGFVDVPIVHVSASLWRSIHPVIVSAEKIAMPAKMIHALAASALTFTILTLFLVVSRYQLGALRLRMRTLQAKLNDSK